MQAQPDHLLKVDEVREILGCGRNMVYQLVHTGELKHVIIGRRLIKFTRDDVQEYINSQYGRGK